jgi:NitT/TauT family transport system permease protein
MKRSAISRKSQSNSWLKRFSLRWYGKLTAFVLIALFWLVIWQLGSLWMGRPLLLPGPLPVLQRLGELIITASFWQITANSLGRIGLGFSSGLLIGLLMALLTSWSKIANALLSPVLKAILAAPVVSFSILLIVWFSNNVVPVYIVFLMVMPVVWENFSAGIRATDGQLLEMARLFKLPFSKKLRRIYLPSIMPYFLAAATSTFRLAWKSGIAAEVISSPRWAIGRALQEGRIYLQIADAMAWTLVVILLSLALEWLLLKFVRRIGRRYNVEQKVGDAL